MEGDAPVGGGPFCAVRGRGCRWGTPRLPARAMADTAGGVIVHGVREDGAGHAAEVAAITDPNSPVRGMRGKAGRPRPFVPAPPLPRPGR